MARVEYEGVWKRFGGAVAAVQDLTLTVDDGELLVLLGPSGCGKTTALRMLAGLEDPDDGDIRIDGKSVVDLEPQERDVALVFQNYALYPHMSVRNNLLYPLKVRNLPQSERNTRVASVAELLGIGHLLDRMPAHLSGGEQQRVALGRAIVRQPSVFLMDEPLSNLDAKLRVHMRTELKALQRRLSTTTIFVTHDQAEAMSIADRIAIMNKGQLQQVGDPDEVYQYPANLFVAQFIGSPPMNVMPAELIDGALVLEGGWRIPVPRLSPVTATGSTILDGGKVGADQSSAQATFGGESVFSWSVEHLPSRSVQVGLRPESILLSFAPAPEAQPAEVFLTEPLGSEVIVSVKLGSTMLKVRTAPDVRPSSGQTVYLSAAPRGLRVFDPESGRAL